MVPTKPGQIVKYNVENIGDDFENNYVVLKIHTNTFDPYAEIQALNTGDEIPKVYNVSVKRLQVVEANTQDLIGLLVNIIADDQSVQFGRIVAVPQIDSYLDLDVKSNAVETNVYVTIMDNKGMEHSGYLIVNM